MLQSASSFEPFHVLTDALPEPDRLACIRKFYGREFLGLEIEPLDGQPIRMDMRFRRLAGVRIMEGLTSDHAAARLADGANDFVLLINRTGQFCISQDGREMLLGPGESGLIHQGRRFSYLRRGGQALIVQVPCANLRGLAPGADEAGARRIAPHNEPLRLLQDYVGALDLFDPACCGPVLEAVAASHIRDLVALAIGSQATNLARPSLGTDQLHLIKQDINANIARHTLSAERVASWHGITLRTLQRMFAADGTTPSAFILEQRLLRAHGLLVERGQAGQKIGVIARACGFRDVSNFNLAFRRRFGLAPGAVRRSRASATPPP